MSLENIQENKKSTFNFIVRRGHINLQHMSVQCTVIFKSNPELYMLDIH